jgi:hypothetical protein
LSENSAVDPAKEGVGRRVSKGQRQSTSLRILILVVTISCTYSIFLASTIVTPWGSCFLLVALSCFLIVISDHPPTPASNHEPYHDKTYLSQLSRNFEHARHSLGHPYWQSRLVSLGANPQQAALSQFDSSHQSHRQQHHSLRSQCRLTHTVPTPLRPSIHSARCCRTLDWSPRCRTQESTHRALHSGWAHEERCPSLNYFDRRRQRTGDGC